MYRKKELIKDYNIEIRSPAPASCHSWSFFHAGEEMGWISEEEVQNKHMYIVEGAQ